ncbi:MAG: hypothetical protein DWQ10_05425 [Calditrichaeota bacterium]|nr:MAG: hypothetical protein DWQ10_05425 [Calditrichota bacterium]
MLASRVQKSSLKSKFFNQLILFFGDMANMIHYVVYRTSLLQISLKEIEYTNQNLYILVAFEIPGDVLLSN